MYTPWLLIITYKLNVPEVSSSITSSLPFIHVSSRLLNSAIPTSEASVANS